MRKNCLNCNHYTRCKDPAKSIIHLCSRYATSSLGGEQEAAILTDLLEVQTLPSLHFQEEFHAPSTREHFDITSILDTVMNEKRLVSPDVKFPEGDFAQAPNFYTWCVSDKFLNQKPFIPQAIISTQLFSEWCPRCSDVDYFLNDYKVTDSLLKFERKVALLENGVCPHCKGTLLEFLKKKQLNPHYELALCAGQRSGKSALIAMQSSYLLHRFLKLERPNEVYGLLKSTVLQGTFTALTFAQANDTLYQPFYGNLLESPWYQDYHSALSEVGSRYGEDLFKLNDTFVLYKHRRLQVYPAGPDKRVLRGRTRIFGCIPGDTLISTTRGLVPMEQVCVGDKVNIGSKSYAVSKHEATGIKQVAKVLLCTGQRVSSSPDHEFVVADGPKKAKKKAKDLTAQDRVLFAVGGKFPKKLTLAEHPEFKGLHLRGAFRTRPEQLLDTIRTLDHFTVDDLIEASNTSMKRGSVKVFLRKWVKQQALTHNGDRVDLRVYSKTDAFSVDTVMQQRNKGRYEYRHNLIFPTTMTPALAYVLGYLVADGNLSRTIGFKTLVKARRDHFSQCLAEVFGQSPSGLEYDEDLPSGRVRNYTCNITLLRWVSFFYSIGLEPSYSGDKVVPWSILQAPKDCVVAFLRAAFECDGQYHKGKFTYNTTSKVMAHQIQQLILNLGAVAVIRKGRQRYSCCYKYGDRSLWHYHVCTYKDEHSEKLFKVFGGRFATETLEFEPCENPYHTLPYERHASGYYSSLVKAVKITNKEVPMFDMTVDCDDHMYQASGVLVKNSCDEIGWFPNDVSSMKNVKMNATEVYIALERSLLTVRAAWPGLIKRGFYVPNAYFLNISSPSSVRDKIMELVRKAQGSRKILGACKPTWEMNPKVPKRALAEEFRKDPVAAMRDYGAQPPLTNNAFLPNKDTVLNTLAWKKNLVKVRYLKQKATDGSVELYGELENCRFVDYPSILALDAGLNNNSFAFACGHRKNGKAIISAVGEIIPYDGMRINHSLLYTYLLSPLVSYINVVKTVADRWNSLKVLADFEQDHATEKQVYSLKYTDMNMTKACMNDEEILFPLLTTPIKEVLNYDHSSYPACFKHKPLEHFALQLLTVQDTGSAVIKGDGLTDDLLRAVFLCHQQILDPMNDELLDGEPVQMEGPPVDVSAMAVYKNLSGGGSVQNTGINVQQGSDLGILRRRS